MGAAIAGLTTNDMNEETLDMVEKRLESFAQTQQALLLENRQDIRADNEKFKEDVLSIIESQIKVTVNGKIDLLNGKVEKIAGHLQDQDVMTGKLMVLLEDKKFIQQVWTMLKSLGAIAVTALSAWALLKQIK